MCLPAALGRLLDWEAAQLYERVTEGTAAARASEQPFITLGVGGVCSPGALTQQVPGDRQGQSRAGHKSLTVSLAVATQAHWMPCDSPWGEDSGLSLLACHRNAMTSVSFRPSSVNPPGADSAGSVLDPAWAGLSFEF